MGSTEYVSLGKRGVRGPYKGVERRLNKILNQVSKEPRPYRRGILKKEFHTFVSP
jgi:hypothetical protein